MNARTVTSLLLRLACLVATHEISSNAKYVQCPTVNLDPVIQKGKRFFNSVTGEYFPIKGIAYYPRPNNGSLATSNSVDFFTDEFQDLWQADIASLQQLGVNTIRIYAVDPSKNHDNFMCALQEAGIYIIVGLLADCEDCGIGPNEAPSCYPNSLKQRGQWIINEFSKYSNMLLFCAGNEVTLYARDEQPEINAACQKKFIRDMRSYVDTCSAITSSILPRKVPIGMANWDYQRVNQALYFNCRTDPNDSLETSEWYGLNTYVDCDTNATSIDQLTGWIALRQNFEDLNLAVPVVISEFGCRERFPTIGQFEAQRTWLQVDALYTSAYVEQFAGGAVFEYSAEKQVVDTSTQGAPWPYYEFMKAQYGVGYYSPVTCDHLTTPCEYVPYPEFDLLQAKLKAVDTSYAPNLDAYVPTGEIPTCPSGYPPLSDFVWPVDNETDLPCSLVPTNLPTLQPSMSLRPSSYPSKLPTVALTALPTEGPSSNQSTSSSPSTPRPSRGPTSSPSIIPTEKGPTLVASTFKPSTNLSSTNAPVSYNLSPTLRPMPVAMPSNESEPTNSDEQEAPDSSRVQPIMQTLSAMTVLWPFILYSVS